MMIKTTDSSPAEVRIKEKCQLKTSETVSLMNPVMGFKLVESSNHTAYNAPHLSPVCASDAPSTDPFLPQESSIAPIFISASVINSFEEQENNH
jgi:hypothetical protein